jgi:uncharacterized protein involved in exopolysaccharide biosynthesis/Mrp family chromosome partitioning ATPase
MLDQVEKTIHADGNRMSENFVFAPPRSPHVVGLREIGDLVRRHAAFILGFVLVCTILLSIAVWSMPNTYTATSALVLERNDTRMLEAVTQLEGETRDRSAIETEMDIITSRVFAGKVVDEMNLVHHPWFNPYLPEPAAGGMADAVNPGAGRPPLPQLPAASVQRDASVSSLLSAIKVTRAGESFAVSVRVQTPDAVLSADLANKIAVTYVNWSRETKLKAMSEAVNFLRERASQIAARIARNETEITVFSRLHDLASDPRDDTLRQRIDQTNTQLSGARGELATASAQKELAQKVLGREMGVEGTPLDSALLTSLRADRARATRERAQQASNLGSNHPQVVSGDSEVSSIDAMIETEIRRVVDELGGKQRVIEERISRLETQLAELQEGIRRRAQAEIRLRELERDLLADQKLHDLVVARLGNLDPYTEIAKPSARVVSAAAVPTEPSFPQTRRIFFGGLVGSIVLAIVLALALESIDVRIRNGQRMGQLLQLPHLADIPRLPPHVPGGEPSVLATLRDRIRAAYARLRPRPSGEDEIAAPPAVSALSALDELVEHPRSNYAEALRSLYLACRAQVTVPTPVILFASPGPGDRRSSVELGFAVTAARDGIRTALIDLDPGSQDLAKVRSRGSVRRIEDVVDGACRLSEAIRPVVHIPGLHIISSRSETDRTRVPIRSDGMRRLIEEMRTSHELIVITSAPMTITETASWLSPFVDGVLVVADFGETTEQHLVNAVARLRINRAPLIGTVLTGVETYTPADHGAQISAAASSMASALSSWRPRGAA